MKKKQNLTTRNMTFCGLFIGIISIMSQISIPMPTNVPLTLQIFAIAFTGYFLGAKLGGISIICYVLLGSFGVPIFTNFKGGLSAITGFTGGFLYGFIILAFLCGLSLQFAKTGVKRYVFAISFGLIGLLIDHFLGALQYSFLSGISLKHSILAVSVPFLVKDGILIVCAYLTSVALSKKLSKSVNLNQ